MAAEQIRIREPAYFVLASLADGPRYGCAIIKDAEYLSDGRVRLATGRLFTLLDLLTGEGFVKMAGQQLVAGHVRCCYRLTQLGLTRLRAEASRRVVTAGVLARAAHGERMGRIVSLGGRVRLGGNRGVT
jgi:PadR family transcriptional regulator, regulatory protein PadR